jgi:hypothetical protein
MKQVINGFDNKELLNFTNQLADMEQRKRATFKGEDLTITDSNRADVLKEAERTARAYAESRNKRGTMPKASCRDDSSVINELKAWLERRKLRGHGKREK